MLETLPKPYLNLPAITVKQRPQTLKLSYCHHWILGVSNPPRYIHATHPGVDLSQFAGHGVGTSCAMEGIRRASSFWRLDRLALIPPSLRVISLGSSPVLMFWLTPRFGSIFFANKPNCLTARPLMRGAVERVDKS